MSDVVERELRSAIETWESEVRRDAAMVQIYEVRLIHSRAQLADLQEQLAAHMKGAADG